MPVKTQDNHHGMMDKIATMVTRKQFKAYASIYSREEIGNCPPWVICTVSKISNVDRDCFIAIDDDGTEYTLPVHHIALDLIIDFELAPKTRVIARRKQMLFPRIHGGPLMSAEFIYKIEPNLFAGVISDEYQNGQDGLEYLVLFDDGHAQYVNTKDIRVVNGNPGIEHVPASVRDFYDYYFNVKWTHRRKADCLINDILRVLLNGKFRNAKVCKFYGHSLMLIHFLGEDIFEWIFDGSDRIEVVHKSVCKFLMERDMCRAQSEDFKAHEDNVSINDEAQLLNGQQIENDGTVSDVHKLNDSNQFNASTKSTVVHDPDQISCNDPKMAVEFLIILAEIRHEMSRSGGGKAKRRIDLFAEKPWNEREALWKRICRFLRVKVDQRNRTELKKLIINFRNINTEFRNAYDYYARPKAAMHKRPVNRPKIIEQNAMAIQQEVTSKVQLMQTYLGSRASGDDNNTSSVNLVQHLDEIIIEFSKLSKQYYWNGTEVN